MPYPRQDPYVGPVFADNMPARYFSLVGQINPAVRERLRRQHGRYAGFGAGESTGNVGHGAGNLPASCIGLVQGAALQDHTGLHFGTFPISTVAAMLAAGKHFYLEGSMGLADNDGKPLWSWPSFHQTAQITPFLHLLTTTIRDGHFGPPCDPARVSAQLDSIAARTLEHHKPMQSPHVSYPRAPMHVRQQPRRAMHGFGHPPCPMPNAGPLEPWGAGHPGLQPHDRAEDMQTIAKMESDEDTLGSGIFDPIGRAPTDNANMGMFESHYSWPGYLARETPFAVSRDITDINGAAFVAVPSGGMPYVDRGMPKPYPILGPTPRPPSIGPTRDVTGRMQQYVSLNSGGHPRSTLNPNAPVRSMPTFQSERESNYWQRPASWPEGQEVQSYPAERPVYTMSSIQPYTPGVPVSGFGVDDPAATGPTKGQMIVAGALIGAATGILVSVFRSRS